MQTLSWSQCADVGENEGVTKLVERTGPRRLLREVEPSHPNGIDLHGSITGAAATQPLKCRQSAGVLGCLKPCEATRSVDQGSDGST
jgi:hypothetical protein